MTEIPKAFNVLLSREEREKLADLAGKHHRSKGAVIRYLIRLGHSMTILRIPRCANGSACLVPHLHSQPGQPDQGDLTP